jgi:hypothetical protein
MSVGLLYAWVIAYCNKDFYKCVPIVYNESEMQLQAVDEFEKNYKKNTLKVGYLPRSAMPFL